MKTPRWYQLEARDAALRCLFATPEDFLILMPTGTGKSYCIADLITYVVRQWPTTRVLKLTHVKELIQQNAATLLEMWPEAPLGIVSAGLNKKQATAQIVYGGVDTVINKLAEMGRRDLIIVDEAHRMSVKEEATYGTLLKHFKALNPNIRVVGYTATGYRQGQGLLTQPYNDPKTGGTVPPLFTHVAYDLTSMAMFNRLVTEGWLAPLIPRTTEMQIDVTVLHTRAGEYVQKEVERQINTSAKVAACVDEIVNFGQDRRAWLVFAHGLANAKLVADELILRGIETVVITATTPADERADALARIKTGDLRCIVNNDVLTTGFDCPMLDLIAVLRATRSTSLWVQILGRGTRPHPGKQNCLVLDFAGNTARLGPINDPVLPQPRGKGKAAGVAPVKVCNNCGVYNHASARECVQCATVFTERDKLTKIASTNELIRVEEPVIKEITVLNVVYKTFESTYTAKLVLQVIYGTVAGRFIEYVTFDGSKKGATWWQQRSSAEVPATAAEARARNNELQRPAKIAVWMNNPKRTKPEIINYVFS
jgi:DNA repair protein RadD